MALSGDLPPQLTKDAKRRSIKRRSLRSKDVQVLLSVAKRAALIARGKGNYTVSPEAIRCVEVLRMMRGLPLTPRLITKTDALGALHLISKNGNPKIRSESRSVINHLNGVLESSRRGSERGFSLEGTKLGEDYQN